MRRHHGPPRPPDPSSRPSRRTHERLAGRQVPPVLLLAVVLAPTPVLDDPVQARLAFILTAIALLWVRLAAGIPDVLARHGRLVRDLPQTIAMCRILGAVVWAAAIALLAPTSFPGVGAGLLGSLLVAVLATAVPVDRRRARRGHARRRSSRTAPPPPGGSRDGAGRPTASTRGGAGR